MLRYLVVHATEGNERVDLRDEDLHPDVESCPICGHNSSAPVLKLQDSPVVRLVSCARCHAAYADRMPVQAALDSYYARYYAKPKFPGLEYNVHFSQPERLADHLMALLRPPPAELLRIVDFGGGDGTVSVLLAGRLLRAGTGRVEISLIDYGTAIRAPESERIRIARMGSVDALGPQYDIVIASASLEHVPAFRQTLTALLAAMKPGARFYARTPYMTPLILLAERLGLSIGFGWPAHLYDMGESFWSRLPESIGLAERYRVTASRPAIVESTFVSSPLRTLAAYLLKAPWWLLGDCYGLVGGWEVTIERKRQE